MDSLECVKVVVKTLKLRGGMEKRYTAKDEAFYRRLIVPEEERSKYTAAKPDRSYRWFRSQPHSGTAPWMPRLGG
jgi:hypothetical protein